MERRDRCPPSPACISIRGGGGMGIGDSGARTTRTFVHSDSDHACKLQEIHRKVCFAYVSLSSLACGYEAWLPALPRLRFVHVFFTIADNEGPCCQLPVGAPSRFLSSIFQFICEAWETTIVNTAAIRSLSIIACAMIASDVDDLSAAVSYRDIWAQYIYPAIQPATSLSCFRLRA